ncbi:MAG: NusA-like transcription termination signal-binding factor [Aigarchaeota archaeon]|nr:NusA-like transcription termination signal-binding factor [Aigarchaeota archaeon]MCX8192388.1 NusA-like transcription termination signal-binding factor [Nitrososphaeria archaeon]MDW7986494.1 NusA-like transcription termination signal-binding factor [Nitrososphaerota archaeon]
MSEGVKLTDKEIKYISLFEAATGASVADCVDSGDVIVFIVNSGELRKVLTRKGVKIQQLSKMLKKKIKVIEYSSDPSKFLENALLPAKVIEPVRVTERTDGRKIAVVTVDPKYKGIAIGKNGKTIELIRLLAKRHHKIDYVIIT